MPEMNPYVYLGIILIALSMAVGEEIVKVTKKVETKIEHVAQKTKDGVVHVLKAFR